MTSWRSAGLTGSVEHPPHTLTETAAGTLELLDEVPGLHIYWQPRPDLAPEALLDELRPLLPRLSPPHVFRWRADGDRRPLEEGVDLWPEALLLARTPGTWAGDRAALLEFVRGDDPEQLAADAAALRRWLGLSPRRP